jgi:Phosphotransferase enzyme family
MPSLPPWGGTTSHYGSMEHSGAVQFTKRRAAAAPGSIPHRLQMFQREVRFYREVASEVAVRVPGCFRAEDDDGATYLELEDLSSWGEGATPVAGAGVLAALHVAWLGRAVERWPWLPRPDATDLVEVLYADRWPGLEARGDLSSSARDLGRRLLGRVGEAERRASASGPATLLHGDARASNMLTSPTGEEVALVDWEDVGSGPGARDLAWFLVSSVASAEWDAAIEAYGGDPGLRDALPAAAVQALLSLSWEDVGSDDAAAWVAGLDEAARRVDAG